MRLLAAIVLAAALAACTTGPRDRSDLRPTANPSAVIATEIAFARAAQEKGQWTAFREFAARDAVMFVPQWVRAHDWLRRQQDPARSVAWQPTRVWSSCDGSFVVSTGDATYPDGHQTGFLTVWQRQSGGEYRWVLDQSLPHQDRPAASDMISASVADCPPPEQRVRRLEIVRGEQWSSGFSNDRTLGWTTQLDADCSRTVAVRLLKDGELVEVLGLDAPPPATGSAEACG